MNTQRESHRCECRADFASKAPMKTALSALAWIIGIFVLAAAFAQDYPHKPVRLIIPYQEKGGTDIIAREVARKLAEVWGGRLTIENHRGGGSKVGSGLVARSASDGYTLLVNNNGGHLIMPALEVVSYDPLKSFVPVAPLVKNPFVLIVSKASDVSNLAELISALRPRSG